MSLLFYHQCLRTAAAQYQGASPAAWRPVLGQRGVFRLGLRLLDGWGRGRQCGTSHTLGVRPVSGLRVTAPPRGAPVRRSVLMVWTVRIPVVPGPLVWQAVSLIGGSPALLTERTTSFLSSLGFSGCAGGGEPRVLLRAQSSPPV